MGSEKAESRYRVFLVLADFYNLKDQMTIMQKTKRLGTPVNITKDGIKE